MKKIYSIIIMIGLSLFIVACGGTSVPAPSSAEIAKIDTKRDCNAETNGVEKVLAIAKRYNPLAKKKGVEFMRFHVSTSGYISAVEKALSSGSKTVKLIGKKKKVTKMDINKAAWRACTFAVRALQTHASSEKSWRLSVPGDGFKY